MSIWIGMAVFFSGTILGLFIGYRMMPSVVLLVLHNVDVKKLRWEENIFGYRPRKLTDNLKAGDVISLKLSEELAQLFNSLAKFKDGLNEI